MAVFRNRQFPLFFSVLISSLLPVSAIRAEDAPTEEATVAEEETVDTAAEHLTGNWGGVRDDLAKHGLKVESILTVDSVSNVSGGISREHNILGKYALTTELDTEKAGLWSNGTFFAYLLGTAGEAPSADVGDAQVTDNIEAYSTVKLYELFYEHRFFDSRVSVLAGLHDFNSEFQVLNYALTLLNSSFGVTKDFSQIGPSIYSTTAAAVRFKVLPTDTSYIMSALYDGIPGDPNDQRGTHIDFKSGDGTLWSTELGINSAESDGPGKYYKAGFGMWFRSTDFEDFAGNARSDNNGFYLIGETSLWREEDQNQGLGAFVQVGFSRADRNQFSRYYGFGLNYTGLIPGWNEDVTAFGLAQARNADDFLDAYPGEFERAETAYELTYRTNVLPYLSLQPNIQFVTNPATSKSTKDAIVLSFRAELAM